MRHLISALLIVAAGIAYAFSVGPLFFGAPLLGWALAITGIAIEAIFWSRVRNAKTPASK